MADAPMSDGEIRRNLERLDRALVDLAKSSVSQDAWNRENQHLLNAISEVEKDCQARTHAVENAVKELGEQRQVTVTRLLALLGVLATLLAGWWAAVAAAKGIH